MRKFISPGDIEGKLTKKRNIFLSILRKYPGVSRQECAKRMQVSTYNITKLTPALIAEGMVIEDNPERDDTATRGRPSLPLRLNPQYEYFAGMDLEASQWRFAIIDFAGNPVYSRIAPFATCRNRDSYVALLEKLLGETIADCGSSWNRVRAFGIGSPGFLDPKNGIVRNYEILPGFKMIPLLDLHRKISRRETFIINNICNLAIYDSWKRPESDQEVVLHVALRSGISTSLNVQGNLYRGSHSRSGEIGLFILPEHGFLQSLAGLAALKQKLPDLSEDFWHGKTEIVNREYAGEKVKPVLDEAMKRLATAMANLASFLDPDEIVVYSTLFSNDNILWEILRNEFNSCRQKQQSPTRLSNSGASELNAAAGAAFYALESIYRT